MTNKTRVIQQITEPYPTIEECYDTLAAMKRMPGHVFSYILTDTRQLVMLFDCIHTDEITVAGQAFVELGEPVLMGALPATHGVASVDVECHELNELGETLGTHVLTIALTPPRPLNLLGENRILVPVTEQDVPDVLRRVLHNRTIGLEVSYSLGQMSVKAVRGPRDLIAFGKVSNAVIREQWPRRS